MMKVGILTHYDVNNQGAQLQMFATKSLLEDNDMEPVIMTYSKNYDYNEENRTRNQISIKSIPYILKEFLFSKGIGLTWFNTKKFMINKKYRLSNCQFANYAMNDCNAIIIGSDECLSLESGCNVMMYGHSCSTSNLVYYAPSFGQTDMDAIEEHNCKNLMRSGMDSIKYLSARDAHTYELIHQLTDRDDIVRVCDPVLLYDFSKVTSKVKLPRKKYMLVYAYDKNFTDKKEIEEIKAYAKKHNLKTVSAGTYHKWCDYNFNCNCIEWLEYFRHAECVVTDTFHGSIVSLISNKPVAIFVRKSLNNNKLRGLIEEFGIEKSNITAITQEELERVFADNIDYNAFNDKHNAIRKTSSEFLLGALNEYTRQ